MEQFADENDINNVAQLEDTSADGGWYLAATSLRQPTCCGRTQSGTQVAGATWPSAANVLTALGVSGNQDRLEAGAMPL